MPLIACPDCAAEISDAAPTCPKCGRPMRAPPPPIAFVAPPAVQRIAGSDGGAVTVKPQTSCLTWGCVVVAGALLVVILVTALLR